MCNWYSCVTGYAEPRKQYRPLELYWIHCCEWSEPEETEAMRAELSPNWIATVVGLALIPLVIVPLDVLAHFTMNSSYRRLAKPIVP